jgi:hypothetical protein
MTITLVFDFIPMTSEHLNLCTDLASGGSCQFKFNAEVRWSIFSQRIFLVSFSQGGLSLQLVELEADKRICEKRIEELESRLSTFTIRRTQELETMSKEHETKLGDALNKQSELAKSNVEKLIKRQEEMAEEIAAAVALKNRAEQRIERITDQTSREIDELELQIKFFRQQEHRNRVENSKFDATSLTDQPERNVPASWNFQFRYDFDSGLQIHKEWPSKPQHVSIQVSPSLQCRTIQTAVATRGMLIQTDQMNCQANFSQTEPVDVKNISTETFQEGQSLSGDFYFFSTRDFHALGITIRNKSTNHIFSLLIV